MSTSSAILILAEVGSAENIGEPGVEVFMSTCLQFALQIVFESGSVEDFGATKTCWVHNVVLLTGWV